MVDCHSCYGTGEMVLESGFYVVDCPDCGGTGLVDLEDDEPDYTEPEDDGFEDTPAYHPMQGRPVPKRIQLSRRKGWRKPEGAVVVSRPSKFANPFTIAQYGREGAVARFEELVATDAALRAMIRRELRGKDVACWCPLDQPCHADVLLRVAASEAEQ